MKKYLNMKEATGITGFHRRTILRHIAAGDLKCYKPKGSQEYRFTQKQIEDFMQSGLNAS